MTSVRVLAARVLMAVDNRRAPLGAEVDRARRGLTDERDRGLLLELTSGVCRWRAELDACLTPCSQRPLDAIDPPLLATLRVAMYQLRHLDRVPAHAVVHESVEAARVLDAPRAAGFVNGVLRTYLRTRDTIALPPRPREGATRRQHLAYLSVTLSHPRWLVARWLDRYGFDATERWCQFNNAAPDITVRARWPGVGVPALLVALEERGVPAARGRYAADVVRLPPGALSSIDQDLRSDLVVQDEGSVLVAHVAGAQPGERVLDLCAAPGGKTMILWADMNGQGQLVASDTRWARMQVLRDTVRETTLADQLLVLDATSPLPFAAGTFDRVFVDVPCSGLGTLRRDPDVKWAVTMESLPALAATQRRILAQAASVVRPGGTLIYATCSSEPDENDAVIDAFLAESRVFAAQPIDSAVGFGELIDDKGRLHTTPPRHGLDAFFAARLVRRELA
ncbi:MAG: 16S rRNA (cytosine(967)-C(5))-methyltransferase RsmB [Vicinamibacterales bacterium]